MASPALGPVSAAAEQGGMPERGGVPDVAGAVVLGCCTGWALIAAVERVCADGVLTADLGGTADTETVTRAVIAAIEGANAPGGSRAAA